MMVPSFNQVLQQIRRAFLAIFGVIKSALCCRRRSRRNSGMLLPVTVDKRVGVPTAHMQSSNYSNPNAGQFSSFYSTKQEAAAYQANANQATVRGDEDEDFFRDMKPRIKRQKKVLLAENENPSNHFNRVSNLLGVDVKASISQSADLGVLEDADQGYCGSWEEEAEAEGIFDAEASLRDSRRLERERRLAEHKRIKMEKEMKKKISQKLIATKLS